MISDGSRPELNLSPGWMNAAGFSGFAPGQDFLLEEPPTTFVTNPISFHTRLPASDRCYQAYPGGFLLHTGWPNPGFRKTLKLYASRWARSGLPLWVHLLAEQPQELHQMVRVLEETEGVSAIEISLPPNRPEDLYHNLVEAALGELPLVLCVPLDQVRAAWVGAAVDLGVSGLVISAPRGMLPCAAGGFTSGRMLGPGLFPMMLQAIGCLRSLPVPLIPGCGVYDQESIDALLAAGAAAVQLDAVLWRGWQPADWIDSANS